jgi:hypothetical protein
MKFIQCEHHSTTDVCIVCNGTGHPVDLTEQYNELADDLDDKYKNEIPESKKWKEDRK